MKRCKLLLPPLNMGDRLITEEGAIVELDDSQAELLANLRVVEILGEPPLEPSDRQLPTEEELILLENPTPAADTTPAPTAEKQFEGMPTEEQLIQLQNSDSTKTNLNTATLEELMALPHIGKAIAQKLISARPLATLQAAKVASGLKESQWAEIEGGVVV